MGRKENNFEQYSLNFHRGHRCLGSSSDVTSSCGSVVKFVDVQTSVTRSDAVRRANSNGIFSSSSRKR